MYQKWNLFSNNRIAYVLCLCLFLSVTVQSKTANAGVEQVYISNVYATGSLVAFSPVDIKAIAYNADPDYMHDITLQRGGSHSLDKLAAKIRWKGHGYYAASLMTEPG